MPTIVLPPSAFTGIYQLFLITSLASENLLSVWWDGTKQLPFFQVEHPDGVSIVHSGFIADNTGFNTYPVFRYPLFEEWVNSYGYRMYFTLPDVPDYSTFYYYLDDNGVSMFIDRLMINGTVSATCSFHVIGTLNGGKVLFCKYNIDTY